MGLLDDAIREHLDLKRRRGADPAEVERAEREALGPVRRGPEEPELVDPGVEEPLAYDHEEDEDWSGSYDDPRAEYSPSEAQEPEPFETGEQYLGDEPAAPYAAAEPAYHEPEPP